MPEYSPDDVEQAGAPTDESLARAFQGGDRAAGESLVRRWSRSIFALCCSHLGNRSDAEDAAQEAFFRMSRDIAKLDAARPPGPWLVGIAKNICRDLRTRRGVTLAPEPVAVPVDAALKREDEERVAAAMESLPPHYHELLIYKFRMNLLRAKVKA